MGDYLKISWGSGCTFADVYYDDGYSDFLFIPAKNANVVEPVYEVVKKESQEKEGRTISPDKTSLKTYKVTFIATESVCDTINTIPLAETVIIQFPDNTAATISGDDVSVNIENPQFIPDDNISIFSVSILFLTDVIIKAGCCNPLVPVADNAEAPIITGSTVDASTTLLSGTALENYFIKGYYREFYQATTGAIKIKKLCMYSALGGFCLSTDDKIYKTTDGFATAVLKYTSAVVLNDIDCFDSNNIVAVGNSGNIFFTTDSGVNWTNNTTGANHLFCVRVASALKVAMCGDVGKLFLSGDFCGTYTAQTTGSVAKLYGLDFYTSSGTDKWLCVGDGGTTLYKAISNYAIDNAPTLTTPTADNFTGVIARTVVGTSFYAVTSDGDVKKTASGASWADVSAGVYTKFNACCLTKYGILCVGIKNILIDSTDAVIDVLDDNIIERTDCSSFNTLLPYSAIGAEPVLNGNGAFTQNGMSTVSQFENGELLITFPTASRTYVVKVQAFTQQYNGSYSEEIVVVIP